MKDVPDEELLIGQDGLDGVEVDVHFVLTGDEVLRLAGVGRMDVAHPVGLAGVVAVDVVEEFVVVVHLRSRQKTWFQKIHSKKLGKLKVKGPKILDRYRARGKATSSLTSPKRMDEMDSSQRY